MRRSIAAAVLVLLSWRVAAADDAADHSKDERTADLGAVPEPVPGISPALTVPSNAGIAAAFTAKPEGSTQYRISLTPLRLARTPYIEVLSELRVFALYDSKTSLTTAGVTIGYNPFELLGARADKIETAALADGCGARYLRATSEYSDMRIRQYEARLAVEQMIDAIAWIESMHLELWLDADAWRGAIKQLEGEVAQQTDGSLKGYQARQAEEHRCTARAIARVWRNINGTAIPSIFGTFATGMFPTGRSADPSMPAQSAQLEVFEGYTGEIDVKFRPTQWIALTTWWSLRSTRGSNAPKTRRADATGGGFTVSVVAIPFKIGDRLLDDDGYRHTGFIPGVSVGVSGQESWCFDGVYCDGGNIRSRSLTPFLDVRIDESVQFRISVPVQHTESVTTATSTNIGPVVSVAGTFGS
ncbi:MAG TPA: hypothetical protein VGM88_04545 [Kofleriaceae bacterium]